MTQPDLKQQAIDLYEQDGLFGIAKGIKILITKRFLSRYITWYYQSYSDDQFSFNGVQYNYFYHSYNDTWRNERAVEIPIMEHQFNNAEGNILEVGNVLSNYFTVTHDIVDKYEEGDNIQNVDVVDYSHSSLYDFIMSISTLEHVGWDEQPKEPKKYRDAIANLLSLLSEGGTLMATIPIGYNEQLDGDIISDKLGYDEGYFLRRISKNNNWKQISEGDLKFIDYGSVYPGASEILIAIWNK